MKRPSHTWLAFGVVALVAMLSLGWLTRAVLRLDDAQRVAAVDAEREERIRLALWRMDSALALLVADENARAPEEFASFYHPARAWSASHAGLAPGSVLLPSPLLATPSTNVRLHFEFFPGHDLSSPEVPPPQLRELALAQGQPAPRGTENLDKLGALLGPTAAKGGRCEELVAAARSTDDATTRPGVGSPNLWSNGSAGQQIAGNGYDLGQSELLARAQNVQNAQQGRSAYANNRVAIPEGQPSRPRDAMAVELKVGRMSPVWLAGELFLVRRVDDGTAAGRRFQGVWIDWPALRGSLVESIRDLVPDAELLPAMSVADASAERHLAALPVRLVPGLVPGSPWTAWSPLRLALVAAWIGIVVAILAIGGLLRGALDLSERRAEFVSAVTHELRTPLTTFRLYSEMLADDMVPDPEQRRQYLGTLCAESNRLGHLVENVLAYARLERGSARNRRERVPLGVLVERVLPRLGDRARAAGLELQVDADPTILATEVDVDVGVVEQILFNLVDNAAKYATAGNGERKLHIEALPERGKWALLRVRDHGQGIGADVEGRLFEPFHRSAEKAAGSAPGVGLGLALCRNLSRSLGGDLRHDRGVRDGAAFVLSLPRAA